MAKKKAGYVFPDTIYIKRHTEDGEDDAWLEACEDAKTASDGVDGEVPIGVYKLVKVGKVVTKTEVI